MDIKILSTNCVKIIISAEECDSLGVCYDIFSADEPVSRDFITSILARLELMDIDIYNSQKLTAEVFEHNGGLIIYISGRNLNCYQKRTFENAMLFNSPDELISIAHKFSPDTSASLYLYNGYYALIYQSRSNDSSVLCAKIREYGKLISDTPLKYLSEL